MSEPFYIVTVCTGFILLVFKNRFRKWISRFFRHFCSKSDLLLSQTRSRTLFILNAKNSKIAEIMSFHASRHLYSFFIWWKPLEKSGPMRRKSPRAVFEWQMLCLAKSYYPILNLWGRSRKLYPTRKNSNHHNTIVW